MAKMTKCGSCGGGRFRSTEETEDYKVAGITYRISVPAEVCSKCDETYFDGPGLVRAERAVAAQVARSGRVSAETFQFMRSAMGIKSKAIAELLGVSPVTVSRWETREREIDPLAWVLLAEIVLEETGAKVSARAILELVRSPPRLPKTVEVASL